MRPFTGGWHSPTEGEGSVVISLRHTEVSADFYRLEFDARIVQEALADEFI